MVILTFILFISEENDEILTRNFNKDRLHLFLKLKFSIQEISSIRKYCLFSRSTFSLVGSYELSSAQVRSGLVRTGQLWSALVRLGQVR